MSNLSKGILSMLVTILCWSGIEILGSLVYLGGGGPITLLQVRYVIATILFFLTIVFSKKLSFGLKKKELPLTILTGGLLAAHLLFFWLGLKNIVSIIAMMSIYFTYPALLAVFSSVFFKKKFTKRSKISLGLGSLGVAFTIGLLPYFNLGEVNVLGVVYLFLAVICWVFYLLFSQRKTPKHSPYTVLFYDFLIATGVFLLLQNPLVTLSELTPNILTYLLLMGVFSTYIAYLFLQKAIKYMGASSVGIMHLSKAAFSIALSYFILHQVAKPLQLFGVGLVLGSVLLLSRKKDE